VVLAVLYWLIGALAAWGEYQGAYQGVTAAAVSAKNERDSAAETAATIADADAAADAASVVAANAANTAASDTAGPWENYKARPPAAKAVTPPAVAASRVAALHLEYRRGMRGDRKDGYEEAVKRGLISDAYALDAIASSAGWKAAGWMLIDWTIGFAVLLAIFLVFRWVWRGFAGNSASE
jgi:hypothetical protein